MSKIILSSDSCCDLQAPLAKKFNVHIIPMIVNIENVEYYDGVNIKPSFIYKSVERVNKLPKTSAISVYDYQKHFKKLITSEDDVIIHFSISSDFSSTHQNALVAASEFSNVKVIDSRNLSSGIALLIVKAYNLINEGKSVEKIVEFLNNYVNYIDSSFVIDKLDYLHKGGRCSQVALLGANIFNLKPCIEVVDGKMKVGKKYRGKFSRVLIQYISDRLSDPNIDYEDIFITHAGVDKQIVEEIYYKISGLELFKNIYICEAGCTISSHCGKDTLGILYARKNFKK